MKNIVIIQARMGSTRLPGKVLKPLWKNETVLEVLVERLRLCKHIDYIIVGTTNETRDLQIMNLCLEKGILCSGKGNKNSALDTVINTIKHMKNITQKEEFTVIDITADCPFIDPFLLDEMLEDYHYYNLDYYSNVMTRSFPIGFDIQIYDSSIIKAINNIVYEDFHRQHAGWNIINYLHELYKNYYELKIDNLSAKGKYFQPDWRIVLDYPEDLILLREIIKYFDRIDFTYKEVMDYLFENPKLLNINKNCVQKIAGV